MQIPIEHNPVTPADFKAVFKVLAGIDGQQRSLEDIETWMMAARSGRWTRAQLAAGTLALSATFTGYRVQPGHLTEQINRIRDKIRATWYCPDPPRELADDPAGELEWRRRAADDFAERATIALAKGDPLDEVPMTLEVEPAREIAEGGAARMRRMLETAAQQMAIPANESRPAGRARDPRVMAESRLELEQRRPADLPADPGAA